MAENKTKPTAVSVASYIAAIADDVKRTDAKAIVKMMQRLTGERPKMWGPSIIGFGSYHYVTAGGREGDMPVVCFSPRKAATVFYIMAGFTGYAALLARLGKHTKSGGCLHVKKLADVDVRILESLIVKSIAGIRAKYPEP